MILSIQSFSLTTHHAKCLGFKNKMHEYFTAVSLSLLILIPFAVLNLDIMPNNLLLLADHRITAVS